MCIANSTDEILRCCIQGTIPVNANLQQAIEAHERTALQKGAQQLRWFLLTAIILAHVRTVEDDRAQLDYLAAVPESEWPPTPAPFTSRREDTLNMIRRSIAWREICA